MRPDVILLDIGMPNGDGLTAAAQIKRALPDVRIIMLTASEEADDLMAAMKAGASGYVIKGAGQARSSPPSRPWPPARPTSRRGWRAACLLELTRTRNEDPLADLTEREREVLELLAQGLSNKEIGLRLSLAEKTVKHYVTAVLQKLHVRSRVEAALLAQRHLPDLPSTSIRPKSDQGCDPGPPKVATLAPIEGGRFLVLLRRRSKRCMRDTKTKLHSVCV